MCLLCREDEITDIEPGTTLLEVMRLNSESALAPMMWTKPSGMSM